MPRAAQGATEKAALPFNLPVWLAKGAQWSDLAAALGEAMTIAQDFQDDAGLTAEQRRLLIHLLASDERKRLEATARTQGTTQRTRADAVRDALDWAAGAGDPLGPVHDEQGRFWNLQREELVQVSINGENITTPPPGEEALLINVLRTRFMPAKRPKLTTPTTESGEYKLVRDWVVDGCPDEPV